MADVERYPDAADLMEAAAERVVSSVAEAIGARGRARIVLSGGSSGSAPVRIRTLPP